MIINVSDLDRSARFFGPVFQFLGYDRAGFEHDGPRAFEDWKRWDHDTPHEISLCQAEAGSLFDKKDHRKVGHHHHIAFCALDRDDVDRLYEEILVPLQAQGLCEIEDPPCDCPEYGEGYYATFFFDPDGLKFEFVNNPNHLEKKKLRNG